MTSESACLSAVVITRWTALSHHKWRWRRTAFSRMSFFYDPFSASVLPSPIPGASAQQSSLPSLAKWRHFSTESSVAQMCHSGSFPWEGVFLTGLLCELKPALSTCRWFLSREGVSWGIPGDTFHASIKFSEWLYQLTILIHVDFCVIQIHLPKVWFSIWSYFLPGLVQL